ncbi:hypothetical protein D3C81_837400 [compost metagenome]
MQVSRLMSGSDFFFPCYSLFRCHLGGVALVGLPLFILLRKYDSLLLLATCIAGCGVPYIMFLDAPTRTALGAIAAGLTVGITAYLLRPVVRNNELDDRSNPHQI